MNQHPSTIRVRSALGSCLVLVLAAVSSAEALTTEDCLTCHQDAMDRLRGQVLAPFDVAAFARSSHGQAEMSCTLCHRGVERRPDGRFWHPTRLPGVSCVKCHRDVGKDYEPSIHAKVNEAGGPGGGATCADCHGPAHDILPSTDPASRVHHHNLARTCIACHEDQALIQRHTGMPEADRIQSYVLSVHGVSNVEDPDSKAATCNNCHGWHGTRRASDPESTVSRQKVAQTCGQCHADVLKVYYESVHGKLAREGNPDVPVCTDCHGEHRIRSPEDRQSTVSRFNIAETCARCHEDPRITAKYEIPIATPSTFYRKSVHGKALLEGTNDQAAACQDCHGHHSILGGLDPASRVNRLHIPQTCGGCHQHQEILARYEKSVHGKAFRRGVRESPVCTDCHGEHTILGHLDPDSPVYPTRLAKEVCGRCHDSLVINRKYGLPTEKVQTYYESYHGLATQLGDTNAANCASCHGVHDILPQSDPESMINPKNLQRTCGKCHPGASAQFVRGLVHVSPKTRENPILFWLRRIYITLIVLTIGGMLLHNMLIMGRHIRDKYRRQKAVPSVVRFPKTALYQHLLLSICFILLVITGFSLRYPNSLFSRAVGTYLGLGETARGIVHRASAVGLTGTIVWHMLTILLTRRGRKELRYLMVGLQDAKDAVGNVGYHLGLTKRHPRFDRYDYSEKMEYWALMWGAVVMAATGFLMWFPAEAASALGLGKVWFDAARVIHFYEAWLATLAIAIWHFFFVMFHPEEYPMALSWITGRLPVESMRERHPKELERLEKEGAIEDPADAGD